MENQRPRQEIANIIWFWSNFCALQNRCQQWLESLKWHCDTMSSVNAHTDCTLLFRPLRNCFIAYLLHDEVVHDLPLVGRTTTTDRERQSASTKDAPQKIALALAFSHILGTYSPMTVHIASMMPCNLAVLHTSKDPTLDNKDLGSIGELHQISTLRHSSNLLVHSCFIAYLLHDKIVHN